MGRQKSYLGTVRATGAPRAIVFLHGFSGDRDDTWDRFPGFVGAELSGWDIYTLGYDTSFLPDVAGVWSADPDLPLVATQYLTSLQIRPLDGYRELALVAHSMGGLVVQHALATSEAVRARVSRVVLFGTPSGGLRKAGWLSYWKRQLFNMAEGSPFLAQLRADWNKLGDALPFELLVVAGSKDQFVPSSSALEPFPSRYHRVVPGDHLQIVKPAGADSESVRLLVSCLAGDRGDPRAASPLRLAAEQAAPDASRLLAMSTGLERESDVVDAALALERAGMQQEAIALLRRKQHVGPDVQGTLGGRMKRLFLAEGGREHAVRAALHYKEALERSLAVDCTEQVFYHAINLAFLALVAQNDRAEAVKYAEVALTYTARAAEDVWTVATQAEASLYLGRIDRAVELYQRLPRMTQETWKLLSAGQQAFHVARVLKDRALGDEIEAIFSLSRAKILLSCSHRDESWRCRLERHLAPYVHPARGELERCDDLRIAGPTWQAELERALEHCKVAVLLVSDRYLEAEPLMQRALPALLRRAAEGRLQLLWFAVAPSAYAATPLVALPAAEVTDPALSERDEAAQERALQTIAKKVRDAALWRRA